MADLETFVGTICANDPELRFTQTGLPVCNFSIKVPAVRANAEKGIEGKKEFFLEITTWRELAENVAESLQKGDRVIVRGIIKTDTYTDREGAEKTKTYLNAWNVGAELSYNTVEFTTAERKEPVSAGVGSGTTAAADDPERPF
jgi:single-strand DNA-binding protein